MHGKLGIIKHFVSRNLQFIFKGRQSVTFLWNIKYQWPVICYTSHVLCKHSNGERASLENLKLTKALCWHALSLAKV